TNPISSQMPRRSQLSNGREAINNMQTMMPKIGITGTNGVLNGLSSSGLVLRSTRMPTQTSVNANSVPILTMCPRSETGTNPAKTDTKIMKIRFVFQGV